MSADGQNHIQLFFQISLSVGEFRRKNIGIATKQSWTILCHDALQPIGIDQLKVGKMANNL